MLGVIELAKSSLRNHEGYRPSLYQCTAGRNTIGYGHNIDDNPLPHKICELLLDHDVTECIKDLETFEYWTELTGVRQAALIDMRFCLGYGGFRGFKKMHSALFMGDYAQAAAEIMDSHFAVQTGRRAVNLHDMMVNG